MIYYTALQYNALLLSGELSCPPPFCEQQGSYNPILEEEEEGERGLIVMMLVLMMMVMLM